MITETLNMTVNDKDVIVIHEGKRNLKAKEKMEVRGLIAQDLAIDKTTNFYPYNNFECSIQWKLKKS